jgi:hypothetical protein
MAEENNPRSSNGGRITTQQFYESLLNIKEDMAEMERRILAKIDCIPGQATQINDLREDVKDLRTKSNVWDGLNSIALIIGTFIGARLGPK